MSSSGLRARLPGLLPGPPGLPGAVLLLLCCNRASSRLRQPEGGTAQGRGAKHIRREVQVRHRVHILHGMQARTPHL